MRRDMVTRLLRLINEPHGTIFAPQERYPTGEQSTFAGVVQRRRAARSHVGVAGR